MGRPGQLLLGYTRGCDESSGLPIAQRNRSCLVQQEHVDIASRLDGAPAHREDILLHETVNARNTDGAEQPANRRRDEANEQGNENGDREINTTKEAKRLQRNEDDQEDDGQRGKQNRQGDFIRCLLSFAPSTSPIIRSRKVSGFEVTRTVMMSESTRVPPVTALRSPPASRTTGADSPVMADSSVAAPSMTSPSPG